jgi:hypothetical protein
MHTQFSLENLGLRNHSRDLGVDEDDINIL